MASPCGSSRTLTPTMFATCFCRGFAKARPKYINKKNQFFISNKKMIKSKIFTIFYHFNLLEYLSIYIRIILTKKSNFFVLFSTTIFIFLPTSTWTCYSHIISIIYIYNIIDISMFLGLGNIYIISIYCIIFIINIYLLWTNRGQCPHPFTAAIILHII